jgi:hypothetical protein
MLHKNSTITRGERAFLAATIIFGGFQCVCQKYRNFQRFRCAAENMDTKTFDSFSVGLPKKIMFGGFSLLCRRI